ncbi:MAG: TolC family protein, partial [Pirellulales bacterium]|nr:TolC family protein [Pirellulales bacterium]
GAELVVGLANQLVWEFSSSNTHTATTLLDFSLVQPLLRAGGRAVVLERLTRVERGLLANIRQLERFRRGFYTDVIAGIGGVGGVSRLGGVFGGSGLEGFSGVGSGGFGQIGNVVGGGGGGGGNAGGGLTGAGGGFAGGAGAAGAGGFLGLLQTQQAIRNREANVAALRDSLAQLDAAGDAGRIDRLQIDQARQALYNAQSQLITSRANYDRDLDGYKLSLGLPPELDVVIKDSLLSRFDLIDPRLTRIQDKVAHMLEVLRNPEIATDRNLLANAKSHFAQVAERTSSHADIVADDIRTLNANLPARRRALEQLANLPEVTDGDLDREAFNVDELNQRVAAIDDAYGLVTDRLQQTAARTEAFDPDAGDAAEARQDLIRLTTEISNQLVELSLVQARARLDAITLVPIELTPEQALEIARCYRRDWMNARAALVDSWRLIDFNANALESDLDLVFEGDISNRGDNPLKFRDSTGRLRVGVEFDAPLTRLSERNQYRQSIIEYSQARRNYYQFEDGVSFSLRNTLRTINLNKINFELRRAAVAIAIAQVELTQLKLSEPPRPGAPTTLSNTTARDLVSALSDLLAVQNDFLSVWVNYQVQRMELDLDLGTMELDAAGNWIDPGAIGLGRSTLKHAPAAPNLLPEIIPHGILTPEPGPVLID